MNENLTRQETEFYDACEMSVGGVENWYNDNDATLESHPMTLESLTAEVYAEAIAELELERDVRFLGKQRLMDLARCAAREFDLFNN